MGILLGVAPKATVLILIGLTWALAQHIPGRWLTASSPVSTLRVTVTDILSHQSEVTQNKLVTMTVAGNDDDGGGGLDDILPPPVKDKEEFLPPVKGKGGVARLEGNYPNPFNPSTEIQFTLPKASKVSLVVYDMTGRVVNELIDRTLEAGSHSVTWDASNLPSGVYVYRFQADTVHETKLMTLLK